ncbi:hypothetical protein [Dactylosporangium sp. NPDC049140]|uniref:hypothetical protein n=1 Tax=Dactylosporangium sp. NPDC049140 TaxID=3155647 RepID=UPI0033DD4A37
MTEESTERRQLSRRSLITGTLKAGAGAVLLGAGVLAAAQPAAAAIAPSQQGWRYCKICKALVYDSPYNNPCPGSATGHDRSGSFNYWISYDDQDNTYSQTGWRYCNKCQALAWGGGDYPCKAGGTHNKTGSLNYALAHNLGAGDGWQQGWVFCNRCGELYFKSERANSRCTVNAFFGHQDNESYAYQLMFGWVD